MMRRLPEPPIVSEVLCFIQNKVNIAPVDIIVKICSDFYDTDYLQRSKTLLHETAKPTVRSRTRRGDKKAEQTVRDMIDIFLTRNDSEVPCYVAKDLSKLPPLDVNDLDVLHLGREIKAIKDSIHELANNQRNLFGIVNTPVIVAQGASEDPRGGQSTKDDVVSTDVVSTDVVSTDSTDSTPTHVPEGNDYADSEYTVIDETCCDDSNLLLSDISVISDSADDDHHVEYVNTVESPRDINNNVRERRSPSWHQPSYGRKSKAKRSHSLENNASNNVVLGTGSYQNVRTADMKFGPIRQKEIRPRPNQTMSGVFVTRLSPNTTARQLALHIRRETSYDVRPERMPVKRDQLYSSWYIRAGNTCRQMLFSSHLWPKHTLIKPYYN